MHQYFIQQFLQLQFRHGGVGAVDAEKVLLRSGFTPILFPAQNEFGLRAKIKRALYLLSILWKLPRHSTVVFIFPGYAKIVDLFLKTLLRYRKLKVVCVLFDINGMRTNDRQLLDREIAFYKKLSYFVVHNEVMKEWITTHTPGARCSILEFFDFFAKPLQVKRKKSFEIVFAGNLEKTYFLKHLHLLHAEHSRVRFHLYGVGINEGVERQPNVSYHGHCKPYELAAKLHGSFGLVWDGDSIDKIDGVWGEYMHYISQHKLSLYIIAKLPIIVPAAAASAALIRKYKIGIVIDSLYDLEERILSLSDDEYLQMQINMESLALKISKGWFLEKALGELGCKV